MFHTALQDLMRWIDTDAQLLNREDLIDGFRIRVLELTRDFVAYPHCGNFSMMPDLGN